MKRLKEVMLALVANDAPLGPEWLEPAAGQRCERADRLRARRHACRSVRVAREAIAYLDARVDHAVNTDLVGQYNSDNPAAVARREGVVGHWRLQKALSARGDFPASLVRLRHELSPRNHDRSALFEPVVTSVSTLDCVADRVCQCKLQQLRPEVGSLSTPVAEGAARRPRPALHPVGHGAGGDQRAADGLAFPPGTFRAGQRDLAQAVYRTAASGRCLLAQAPTGIGKTVGTLFPLLRAMPGQGIDKIAYLTCKGAGRLTALEALDSLRAGTAGQALRVVAMVPKDQACEYPDKACHGDACTLARGFYDRLPAARDEAVALGWLDAPAQRRIALRHGICPYCRRPSRPSTSRCRWRTGSPPGLPTVTSR